jgi:hypothetical protein
MLSALANHGIERFDDLHIDEIDPSWSIKSRWMMAATDALSMATECIGSLRAEEISVAVGISLVSVPSREAAVLRSVDELRRALDVSPPSLYLFHRDREPWKLDADFSAWSPTIHLSDSKRFDGFLRQWWDADERVFHRALFLVED